MVRNALFLLQKAVESEEVEKIENGKIYSIGGRNGSNTLFVAPHGVYYDDDYTGLISKHLSDHLKGYGVINEKYQKPETIGLKEDDLSKDIANLNRFNQIDQNEELKKNFLAPILEFKSNILKNNDHAFIFHIHGISDDHIHRVAKTIEEYKGNPEKLHVLIGYGQREDDKELLTADEEMIVQPLIEYLKENDINAAIAPTIPIMGNDGEEKIYCGSDPNGLNQKLCDPKDKVQSIQLEIKKSEFRKNEEQAIKMAERLGMALSKLVADSPDQIVNTSGKETTSDHIRDEVSPGEMETKPELENKKVGTDDTNPTENQPSRIEMRKIANLKHHPLNQQIYGDPDPDDDLKISIQQNGILTPLLISDDDRVLSGHRRYACAEELDIKEVPVIVSPLKDELEIEETLINANIQRQKTKEQIAREYMKLKEIEREKAKQRQAEAGGDRKSDESKKSLTQNSAEAISKGESRKKASSKLGISYDTGEKAAKVVLMADDLEKAGKVDEARSLLDTLNNKSVNKAHKEAQTIEGNIVIPKEKGKPAFNKTNENIEWASWTWNPVTGCNHGCKYCYARERTNRFKDSYPNGFEPTFCPKRLDAPGNTKFPVSKHIGDRNVFVVSMGDLFGDWVEQEWIDAVLESVRKYPKWNYLFLTKNPKRLVDIEWPDNAWVGTTVDIQARVKPAEEAFEKIKAKVKFLSCEPLSEELTFTNLKVFDWVIIGARSKTSGAPAMQPKREWVQSLMHQAWDAGCEVYCKPNLKSGVKEYPLAGVALKNINKVKSEDNPEPNFNAPVIISASRRTDIPAFHSDWFMHRLRQGRVIWENPYNRQETISSFDKTRLIVFWTKNPGPMFDYLDEIDNLGLNYYFQFTLNDYEDENLEPNIPPFAERIETFQQLSKRIGKERVIWRFDPLILTDAITKEKLVEKVYGIGKQLYRFTGKLVFSFVKIEKAKKNLDAAGIKYRYFSDDDIKYLAEKLGSLGRELGIEVAACAEEINLSSYGIAPNKCIDDGLIKKVFNHDEALMEFVSVKKNLIAPGQQKHCGCIKSTDIGYYDTCKHFCRYCYANKSEKIVNDNFKRINNTSERLLP